MTETTEDSARPDREYTVRGEGYTPGNGEWVGCRAIERSADPERLRPFGEHPSRAFRQATACNIFTPKDVLDALAHDADPLVRTCVAGNRAAAEATLRWLAEDEVADVRSALHTNSAAPVDILENLMGDSNPSAIRRQAAWAERTLENNSAEDGEGGTWAGRGGIRAEAEDILVAVARNPWTPGDLLDRLADRPERAVRVAVAGNRRAYPSTLVRLQDAAAFSEDDILADAVIAALRAREFDPKAAEYFTEKDLSHWRPYLQNEFGDWIWVHPMLEGSESAPEDGSDLPDPLTFARSERTTPTLLRHLAKTGDRTILLALARNGTTPMDVLWQLAAHDDAGIAQAAQELIARIDVKGTAERRKAMEDAAFESGVVADAILPNDPAAIDALAGSAPAQPSAPEEPEPYFIAPPAFAQDLLSILADDEAASGTYGSLSFNWLSFVKDTDSRTPVTFGLWDGCPLSWQVVDVVGKSLCLVCDTGVEFVPFSESGEPTSWERSSVKAWLESTFLAEAFNDDERAIITEVTCLDIEEVKRCLDDEGIACKAAPRLIGRGDPETDASGRCEWWLRPLIETEELISAPRFGLSAIYQEWIERGCTADKPYVAVRPALWVEMQ